MAVGVVDLNKVYDYYFFTGTGASVKFNKYKNQEENAVGSYSGTDFYRMVGIFQGEIFNTEYIKVKFEAKRASGTSESYYNLDFGVCDRRIEFDSVTATNYPAEIKATSERLLVSGTYKSFEFNMHTSYFGDLIRNGLILYYRSSSSSVLALKIRNLSIEAYKNLEVSSPIGEATNTSQTLNFRWSYSSATKPQIGYIIQYSKDKTNWSNLVNANSTSQNYAMPANTLQQGIYYWRMCIKTSSGNTSWSDVNSFKLVGMPTVSGIELDALNIDNTINVSWASGYQVGYEIVVLQNNVEKIKYSANSTAKKYTIPARSIDETGSTTVKVRVKNEYSGTTIWTDYATKNVNLTNTVPAISLVSVNQTNIDNPIIVAWESTNQSKYKLEVLQGANVVKTYTGTTAKSHTIAVGQLQFTGSVTFRLKVAYASVTGDSWSSEKTTSQTLTRIVPKITNFNVVDEFWEKDIDTNWRAENQSRFELEVLKDNTRVQLFTGNASTSFVIPKGTITASGNYTIRVRPIYVPSWSNTDLSTGDWVEKNVSLKDIIPTINNLSLSGSNIDLSLTLSWDSTDQSKYEIEVYKSNDIVDTRSGTTSKSFSYPHSTFTVGLHKFRVRVAYTGVNGDKWTEWKEISATLTETLPSIGVLEPDGVIVDRDNPIRIWWTSLNQSKWKIVLDDNVTYKGTAETYFILDAGTLQTGTHKIVLTVTYVTSNQIEKYVSKKAEFIVQGKPPIPTITSSSEFMTSRPTIVWDSSDQQGYVLEVLKDNILIYTTEWENGLINTHKVMYYLEDGLYKVRVKTINQFGMESDWGMQQISISTIKDDIITVKCMQIGEAVSITWKEQLNKFNKFYVLRNNDVIAKTIEPSYVDNTANGDCKYIIRGITENDVYVDSKPYYMDCVITTGIAATVGQLEDTINVGISRNANTFSGSIELEHELVYLSGREYPVSIFGEYSTDTYSFKFTTRNSLFKFLDMCRRRQVFCYRDKRQTLYLTIPKPSYTLDKFGIEYSVQATQVDYRETIYYD